MPQFKTNCQRDKLKEIRQFVVNTLSDIGLCKIELHKIILAVDEVCANLMIHSNNCNPLGGVEVFIETNAANELLIEIIDYGIGFNYHNYKEPNLEEIVRKRKKGGLGILLVKKIMDTVEFKIEENKNICKMLKKIKKKDV